jgi:hypothetical protein
MAHERSLPVHDDDNGDSTDTDRPYESVTGSREAPSTTPRMKAVPMSEALQYEHALTTVLGATIGTPDGIYRWGLTPGRVGTAIKWEGVILQCASPNVQAALRAHAHVVGPHYIGAAMNDIGGLSVAMAIRCFPDVGSDVIQAALRAARQVMSEQP